MKPLIDREYEKLEWDNWLQDFKLVRIRCPVDGSCYFHAISKAYFKPYIKGSTPEGVFDRNNFIKNLRKDLSKTLGTKVDPQNPKSKTFYQTLANGELESISKSLPKYSLNNMQKELDSNSSISNYFNEFISDQLNIDIYILDAEKQDVYMTASDLNLLYKNRKSIVLLYLPGHYELVGLNNEQSYIETYFDPSHSFIQKIRKRMNSKISSK